MPVAHSLGDRQIQALLAACFLLSRIAAHFAGLTFDASTLDWYYQFLDPFLLRTDLSRSLFYLHSQPPLFNLFLGIVLKSCAGFETQAFAAIFSALGLAALFISHALLLSLGVRRSIAFAFALLLSLTPSALLSENLLFYDLPSAVLLGFSALCLSRIAGGARRSSMRWLFAFALSLAALGWLRSVFHLLWFISLFAIVPLAVREQRRRLALAIFAALLLVFALYEKNQLVFGKLTASSWLGMSLAKIVWVDADPRDAAQLFHEGKISRITFVVPFSPLADYPEIDLGQDPEVRALLQIPALGNPLKRNGQRNLNHLAYVQISEQYERDALVAIRERPSLWLSGISKSLCCFFLPTWWESPPHGKILAWQNLWSALLGPSLHRPICSPYPLLIALGFIACAAALHRLWRPPPGTEPTRAVVAFMLLTIVFISLVANLTELYENTRFRFLYSLLHIALLGIGLEDFLRFFARRPSKKQPGWAGISNPS